MFWHLAYIWFYLKKRSCCGETLKQESMEKIDCAETHGLLEVRAPKTGGALRTNVEKLGDDEREGKKVF